MRYLVSFLLGLCVGSFANVCILRLPGDESLVHPRSHCPRCGRRLRNIDNVPLVSFLILKGRCFYCRAAISWQYPVVEATLAALFLFHAWYFAASWRPMLIADLLAFYGLTISVIDYRHRIIPDELSFSLMGIGWLVSFGNPFLGGTPLVKFLQSAAATVGGGLFMLLLAYAGEKFFKKEALGGGDVKLIAASGAILGWSGIAGPLFLGSLSGGTVALVLLLMKKKKLGETLPFGPFLSLGIYLTCLFPAWWVYFFQS